MTNDDLTQPHRTPPRPWVSTLLKVGSGLLFLGGTIHVCMGAMNIANPGKDFMVGTYNLGGSDRTEAIGKTIGGAIQLGIAAAGFQHANFAEIVHKANHRDKLLLEKLKIEEELEKTKSR